MVRVCVCEGTSTSLPPYTCRRCLPLGSCTLASSPRPAPRTEASSRLTEEVTRQQRIRVTLKLPSLIWSLGSLTWKLSSLFPAPTITWQPFSGKSVTQGSNLR